MNKKGNTLIFMVLATLVNVLLLIVFFTIGFVLLSLYLNSFPDTGSGTTGILTLLVFLLSIMGTFLIYNKLIKFAVKKWNLEDKLYPFLAPKNKRPRDGE